MSDIERRALLGAAGLVGMAALMKSAKAGPIDPPAAPVGPTGHTLDEIYNKVPALPNGTGDGRIAIPGGTTSVPINAGGSYVLTGNIAVTGTTPAITITNSNVTLDLNGYTLSAPATTSAASVLSIFPGPPGVPSNVTVRNGSIVGGNAGVTIGNSVGVILENLRVVAPQKYGVFSNTSTAREITIRACTFTDIGGGTIGTDPASNIFGIYLTGNPQTVITDNIFGRLFSNGAAGSTFYAIFFAGTGAQAVVIARNTIACNPSITQPGINAAIFFTSTLTGVLRDNSVIGFSPAYAPYSGNGGSASMTNGGGNV